MKFTPAIKMVVASVFGITLLGVGGFTVIKSSNTLKKTAEQQANTAETIAALEQQVADLQKMATATSPQQKPTVTKEPVLENTKITQVKVQNVISTVAKETSDSGAANSPIKISNPPLTTVQLVAKVKDSVVYIDAGNSKGSGFIVDSSGLVATNAHVVKNRYVIKITLVDGTTVDGYVTAFDSEKDVALIKINPTNLKPVEFGDASATALPQGSNVYAFGFPFGLEGEVSFKDGTMSRRTKIDSVSYFETNVQLLPGNSGGPLVNSLGQVVGMNAAAYGQHIDDIQVGESIKLALPGDILLSTITILKTKTVTYSPIMIEQGKLYSAYQDRYEDLKSTVQKAVDIINTAIKNGDEKDMTKATSYVQDVHDRFNSSTNAVYPKDVPFSQTLLDSYNTLSTVNDSLSAIFPVHHSLVLAIQAGVFGASYHGAQEFIEKETVLVNNFNAGLSKLTTLESDITKAAETYFMQEK